MILKINMQHFLTIPFQIGFNKSNAQDLSLMGQVADFEKVDILINSPSETVNVPGHGAHLRISVNDQ